MTKKYSTVNLDNFMVNEEGSELVIYTFNQLNATGTESTGLKVIQKSTEVLIDDVKMALRIERRTTNSTTFSGFASYMLYGDEHIAFQWNSSNVSISRGNYVSSNTWSSGEDTSEAEFTYNQNISPVKIVHSIVSTTALNLFWRWEIFNVDTNTIEFTSANIETGTATASQGLEVWVPQGNVGGFRFDYEFDITSELSANLPVVHET